MPPIKVINRFRSFIIFLLVSVFVIVPEVSGQKKNRKKASGKTLTTDITLAENSMSLYRILLPSSPTRYEQQAATVLQDYLLEISGAALPIISADKDRSRYEIVLGQNDRLDDLNVPVNFNTLKEDGFLIQTDSMRLIIAGGSEKGTLYGVYSFLEKYLGCRMFSAKVKMVPTQQRIVLGKIHDQQVPVIGFRTTLYEGTWDKEYIDWHKLDHDEKGRRTEWGMWVHTFNELVPPDQYYEEHPEYFAMVDGKRLLT